MSKVIFYILVLLCVFKFHKSVSVDDNISKTTEILFNLTNYAIESRQIRHPCLYATNNYNYIVCMKKYGLARPPLNYYPYGPQQQQQPQSLMDILFTIANNDALRCVPRLLCEATSDTISRSRQGFTLPTLPFNIDTGSIISLLSTIDLPGGSPIPVFAKAAVLGYLSKGNSDSCLGAYPNCPRDPNKLVQYLNNYNGGFFRYFNGLGQNVYPHAQKRIQNKPNNDIVFFSDDNYYNRLPKKLSFPTEEDNRFNEFALKKPKELPFSISDYYFNELDLQRPLPDHKVTPLIFPVRTGTGELRLDAEELNENYKQTQYNLQSNNFVSFRPAPNYEGIRNDRYNLFSFPA